MSSTEMNCFSGDEILRVLNYVIIKSTKNDICLLLGVRTYKRRLQQPTMKRRVAYLLLLEGESPGLGKDKRCKFSDFHNEHC